MNKFFKKLKKLERKHLHELAMLCGAMALLLTATFFVSAGVPKVVQAWTIYISYLTSTPVERGGNTTIRWYAGSAQYCTLSGPTLPCVTGGKGLFFSSTVCSVTTYGTNPGSQNYGNVNTGPVNGPTTYTLSCFSPAGCSWGCHDGNGSAAITVYPTAPTPTTFTSLTASPSILKGNTATVAWAGSKGTHFSACELTGGQYGGGTWFTSLPGSVTTSALNTTTTYNMNCFDTTGVATGWKSATVTVVAPLGVCNDIPTQATVPTGCINPVPSPGICIPTGGSYAASSNTCVCPAGKHLSGSSCVTNPLCSNGLADSYAPSCACPAHQYQPLGGSSCVVLPVCSNGLSETYSPSCACPSGQVQIKGGTTCTLQGVISSLIATPSRVRKGNATTIQWTTAHMSVCALSSLDSTATKSLSSALTSSVLVAINSKTIFTLTCADASGASYSTSITADLVPQVIEN